MIGGFKNKVTDIDFKYTTDPSRIFWVKTFYPHLGKLVHAIRTIDYKSYAYSGPYTFTVQYSAGWKKPFVPNPYLLVFDEQVINIKGLDCNFFGGICYELLNDSSRNTPPLSNYVDPTGDIDIAIICNFPEETKEMTDKWVDVGDYAGCKATLIIKYSSDLRKVNDYYLDAAHWIHSKLVDIATGLQLDIPNSVDFNISEYDIRDRLEFIDVIIGKSHVIMYVEGDTTIKIQLIYKIVNSDGLSVIDHVAEFLITPPEDNMYERKFQTIKDGIEIQDMESLFTDNFEAHQKRARLIQTEILQHKPINHTARILYLFEYIKQNQIEVNWRDYYGIFKDFMGHRSYKEYNKSLMYYKITKGGVFERFDLNFMDVLSAYGDIINAGGLHSSPYNDEKYTMIQALVLNNVRGKSIPQSLKDSILTTRDRAESRSMCHNLFRQVQSLTNMEITTLLSDKMATFVLELTEHIRRIHSSRHSSGLSVRYIGEDIIKIYPVMDWLSFYGYIIPDEWNDGNPDTNLVELMINDFRNNFKLLKRANNIPTMLDKDVMEDLEEDEMENGNNSTFRQDLSMKDSEGTRKLLICAYLSISKCHPPNKKAMGVAHTKKGKTKGKRNKNTKKGKRGKEQRKKIRTNKKY